MPLGEKKVRRLTGFLLMAGVLITRLPFISHKLFEFDSIDFAVATFRFSLEQVTPHFPGYILHILFAKFLLLFIGDVNLAFVSISILLSIGSVLFLWRAGAALRGERVGVICAVLWLFTPIFWFYGEVATSYIYEAFFASAFLYLGISLLKNPERKFLVYLLFITLSLATGARQSSILFFTPCVIYLIWKTRQPLRIWAVGLGLFIFITTVWLSILFSYSGGIEQYFAYAGNEVVYKSQSVLFGNSFQSHVVVIGKVFVYLAFASLPFIIVIAASIIFYWKRTVEFINSACKKTSFVFTMLVALPPFLFYIGIYFMKAGYLLNILPSIALIGAVLLDQMTICRAEKIKRASENKLLLTRPLITSGVIRNIAIIVLLDLCIFLTPFPWTCREYFDNSFTRDSFNEGITLSRGLFLNRLASFTNIFGVSHIDHLHDDVLAALKNQSDDPGDLVLLDTWWHRWGYYYLPQSTIYDIRDFPNSDSLWIGRSQNYNRKVVEERIIRIPRGKEVLLLLREDHPECAEILKQIHHHARLNLPHYLDVYIILDETFSFRWKDVLFIKE
jgi:hypothetical protein